MGQAGGCSPTPSYRLPLLLPLAWPGLGGLLGDAPNGPKPNGTAEMGTQHMRVCVCVHVPVVLHISAHMDICVSVCLCRHACPVQSHVV